jgi:hypothetical protein
LNRFLGTVLVVGAVFATGLVFVDLLNWFFGIVGLVVFAFVGLTMLVRDASRWVRRHVRV